MSARVEMAGRTFGRWTVLSYSGQRKWRCRCECGQEQDVEGASLRLGRSAGCISCHTSAGPARTHGEKRTRLYSIWSGMIDRCENPNCEAFPNYGGRGISICPEWRQSFESFRDWARANGYTNDLTIDRYPDQNGDYEPNNCRWATYAEQNRNYGRNRPVKFRGRSVLICDLAVEVGLPQDILKNRIFRYGWPIEQAVSTPVLPRGARRPVFFTVEHRNIDALEAA